MLPGFSASEAVAINVGGPVVGGSHQGEGAAYRLHAVRWSPSGVMQDLGMLPGSDSLPGGDFSYPWAINTRGQVVGNATITVGGVRNIHAVLWSPSGMIRDLGMRRGDEASTARGINDAGQVVGISYRELPHTRSSGRKQAAW
ncbi:MAG TPA: hypothetical protein VHE78_07655 [Gemmatimonadaceae bacterium]|nr:hypothetical protein [Gemmatimonadaceae bacterium]